jgi:hypothetical protein
MKRIIISYLQPTPKDQLMPPLYINISRYQLAHMLKNIPKNFWFYAMEKMPWKLEKNHASIRELRKYDDLFYSKKLTEFATIVEPLITEQPNISRYTIQNELKAGNMFMRNNIFDMEVVDKNYAYLLELHHRRCGTSAFHRYLHINPFSYCNCGRFYDEMPDEITLTKNHNRNMHIIHVAIQKLRRKIDLREQHERIMLRMLLFIKNHSRLFSN